MSVKGKGHKAQSEGVSEGSEATAAGGSGFDDVGDSLGNEADIPVFTRPEGYQVQTSDVVGFWDGDRKYPIHFIPETATLHDSDLDKTKVSILLKGRLVEPCQVYLGDDIIEADIGDMVGVWAKPGMKSIRDLGGEKVWMIYTGTKEVDKPSPMKTFEVTSVKKGYPIPVVGDYRDKSRNVRHLLEGAPLSHSNTPKPQGNSADSASW